MASRRTALLATVLGGVLVTIAGRSFHRLAIAEHSMEPALSSGDFVIARSLRKPQRGDIVTLPHPERPELLLVKRVVGLPSEMVTIRNSQVHIDTAVLPERWADGPTRPDAEWLIGYDEVLVLSDNRSATLADSRSFGPVPVQSLQHRLSLRYWPPATIGRIR